MSIEDLGIMAIPAITVIVFLIAEAVKNWTPIEDKRIPSICGLSGAILGVIAHYIMADFPAHDIISAIAVGVVSGFAATGIHQAFFKQPNKDE